MGRRSPPGDYLFMSPSPIAYALAAVLGLAVAASANADAGKPVDRKASASIDLRVVIPTVLRVSTVSQASTVRIDESHVAQGYVDLDQATMLQLASNSRRGMDIGIALDGQLVSRAVVRMLGVEIEVEGGHSTSRIASQAVVDQPVGVSYRLYLNARAEPGTYRWPVSLMFSPVSA